MIANYILELIGYITDTITWLGTCTFTPYNIGGIGSISLLGIIIGVAIVGIILRGILFRVH